MSRPSSSDTCKKCLTDCSEICQNACAMVIVLLVAYVLFGGMEFTLGLAAHLASDWVKEHKISIVGGSPETMKLFEICDHWPPRSNVTMTMAVAKGCPDIDYEYAFVGMLFVSILLPLVLCCVEFAIKIIFEREILLALAGLVITHLGLVITAVLFIISGRQSGKIIGKEVVILDGPYRLHDTMKIVIGSFVICMSVLRLLFVFLPSKIIEMQMKRTEAGNTERNRRIFQYADMPIPIQALVQVRVHPESSDELITTGSDSDAQNNNA